MLLFDGGRGHLGPHRFLRSVPVLHLENGITGDLSGDVGRNEVQATLDYSLKIFNMYLFCVCMCTHMHANLWRAEGNLQELVLSCH